jgi:hypothetical protein
MLYRKHKESVDGKWHFNQHCVSWPRENFFDMAVPEVDEHDLLCSECVRLRSLNQVAADFLTVGSHDGYVRSHHMNPRAIPFTSGRSPLDLRNFLIVQRRFVAPQNDDARLLV